MNENFNKSCGSCLMFMPTYLGGECRLTDNAVDDSQPACIDYIKDDSNDPQETELSKEVNKHGKIKRDF